VAVVIALGVVAAAGCGAGGSGGSGDSVTNGVSVTNRTQDDLTIVYLVGGTNGPEGPIIDRSGTEEIGVATRNGTTLLPIPTPTQDGCTVAPMVARRPDGSEASRLDSGACVLHQLVEWTVE
jgi:hypothetical protein